MFLFFFFFQFFSLSILMLLFNFLSETQFPHRIAHYNYYFATVTLWKWHVENAMMIISYGHGNNQSNLSVLKCLFMCESLVWVCLLARLCEWNTRGRTITRKNGGEKKKIKMKWRTTSLCTRSPSSQNDFVSFSLCVVLSALNIANQLLWASECFQCVLVYVCVISIVLKLFQIGELCATLSDGREHRLNFNFNGFQSHFVGV